MHWNKYVKNFSEQQNKICSSLRYNGANSYLFVITVKIYKFKEKVSKINAALLCLCNVLKDFSADKIKNTALYGLYDFLSNYDIIYDILAIYIRLMKKYYIKEFFDLLIIFVYWIGYLYVSKF